MTESLLFEMAHIVLFFCRDMIKAYSVSMYESLHWASKWEIVYDRCKILTAPGQSAQRL